MKFWQQLLLLWVVIVVWAPSALALDILVIRPPPGDEALFEAFGRLRAELELQGFEVQVLSGSGAPIDTDELEREAQKRGAFAAVALQRKPDGMTAEVRIVDRVTGKTTTRKIEISKAKDGALLLAIRAADLLRASLLELGPGQVSPEDVVGAEKGPPPREVVRFSRELSRFQIGAGALMLFHPDLGVSFGGSVSIHFRLHPRLMLGLNLGGPVFGGEYRVDDNSASIRQEFALFQVAFNLAQSAPGPRVEAGPLLELGAMHVSARGDVAPPLVAQTNDVWAFAVAGGAFVEVYLSETVSVGFQMEALGLMPQPVVAIADARSAPLSVQGMNSVYLGISF